MSYLCWEMTRWCCDLNDGYGVGQPLGLLHPRIEPRSSNNGQTSSWCHLSLIIEGAPQIIFRATGTDKGIKIIFSIARSAGTVKSPPFPVKKCNLIVYIHSRDLLAFQLCSLLYEHWDVLWDFLILAMLLWGRRLNRISIADWFASQVNNALHCICHECRILFHRFSHPIDVIYRITMPLLLWLCSNTKDDCFSTFGSSFSKLCL